MPCPHARALNYNARMPSPCPALTIAIHQGAGPGLLSTRSLSPRSLSPGPLSPSFQPSTPRLPAPTALLLALLTVILLQATRAPAAQPLHLAVATNFRSSAETLATMFTQSQDIAVVISSASTGVLAAQLRHGAPFDLLLAADSRRPRDLIDSGDAAGGTSCYAVGTLVLLGADSMDALGDPQRSLALADPRLAPYGAAAESVVQREQFAGANGRRIVMGKNVQQALQFFSIGGTDLALVARSLSPGHGLVVPTGWHAPIEQHAVISAHSESKASAAAFLAFLKTSQSQALLRERGYQPCS